MKGQVVWGNFSTILMRVKAGERVELGELCVIEHEGKKFILQVYDLSYGSQISQQNLEMVAGMNLEEEQFSLLDPALRNYQVASLKPLLVIESKGSISSAALCKMLPPFFSSVRNIVKDDLSFITRPQSPLFLGSLRSGSQALDFSVALAGKDVLSHHMLIAASTGKGKSNLMSCLLWDVVGKEYAGMVVLDPHDEYYGRTGLGLKDHPSKQHVVYYTPYSPPVGTRTLKLNLSKLKPEHFSGAIALSEPQRQCLYAYHKRFGDEWIKCILEEKRIEGVAFHEDTIAVVKRKLVSLLDLELDHGQLRARGVFDAIAGENTITELCNEVERGKIVIIDTSYFSGSLEIMIGSIIASELFDRYKYYKREGRLDDKPVISIVLEEAPRVLGKKVLEQGSNVFESIAREGRKFKIGLLAITQLPSEIPKSILANMNTKIILGLEMGAERQAIIESAPQDLSQDTRTIASLDKGEALVTSTFTRFALPVKVPLFSEFSQKEKKKEYRVDDSFFS
ncbi:ATP-binding protein [Candidatus Woesearchaeota archaeon]|nr:ATP-binding protein [Candidatus Woesearchaeota archaeon]